ncbi:PREDICTED: uncharacterized protein LOC109237434 [Nicotiana attenuata]|uniref:uncharacterized protein LOC109237434 n=1 Tax=Nicotiana attenuata TaxID=49451 RepID=UPI000905883A|nr:PREDICTED: uncharacterized protein LOC109237434 [Nicotiana attenuata]
MGDFNALLQQENKIGGNQVALSELVDFQDCIDKCILMELPNNGYKYSWNDKQGANRIFSKIDWVFVNGKWIYTMQQYKTHALPEEVRDRCPLVVEMIQTQGVTAQEVKKAIFGINFNKSPGPDGYGAGFYKDAWRMVRKDITGAVIEFFSNGQMLNQLNATMITFIPKVLCNRLTEVLPTIVSENQVAFVKGMSLVHNVLMCSDLLRHYNRKTIPRCLMKIALRKAYDMIQWEFIEEMLKGYGFPPKFIQLIMACNNNKVPSEG